MRWILPVCLLSFWLPAGAAEKPSTEKQALGAFNDFIGEWRGVGQLKRGSRTGAWIEKIEWSWKFGKTGSAIVWKISKGGKQFRSVEITWLPKTNGYQLAMELPDKTKRLYAGTKPKDEWVFESKPGKDGVVHRVTITPRGQKRTVVLLQYRKATAKSWFRTAEIGYTRAGTSIAGAGGGGPICIVTGGKGTIAVNYKGKTYYVCCSGCKQAFDDDPDGVVKEYLAKLKKKPK